MIRKLYQWTLELASRPNALWLLALVAFVESTIFPIPPDVMIIPMILAARAKAWQIAGIATISSFLGSFVGYAIGLWLFDLVGQPLIEVYGLGDNFSDFQDLYLELGPWIVFGAGLTPFPFKVITIASGAMALDPIIFGVAVLLARGLRFYGEAAMLWKFGPPIRDFVEKRLGLFATPILVLIVGGFISINWMS